MIKTKFEATIATMITSLGSSLLLMGFNVVYNQFLINYYGSSVNGLISTISQFVALFSIVEGGATTAAVVAVYRPYIKNETDKINNILYTVKVYFHKIAIVFGGLSFIGGLIYLKLVGSPLYLMDTILILVITVFSTMVSIGVNSRYIVLLSGSNKSYIVNIIYMLSKVLTWSVAIVLMVNRCNILLVYCIHGLNTVFEAIFLRIFVCLNYSQYGVRGVYNSKLLKGTKDVFFQKIASSIFSSTDLIIISAYINFELASVYNTYNLIFSAVFALLNAVSVSPMNSFGHLLNSDNKNANKMFAIYQKAVQISSSVFLISLGVTIIPFLKLYTKNVSDVNYIIPSLVFLFYTYYYIKLNNAPFGMVLNVTGRFSQQNIQCGISAVANIVLSLALVSCWGVQGVVLGSALGALIILGGNVYQASKVMQKTIIEKSLNGLLLNYFIGLISIMLVLKKDFVTISYFSWIGYGMISFLVVLIIVVFFNYIIDRKAMISMIGYLKEKLLLSRKRSKRSIT